jgi:hypothetical protein
MKYLTLLLIIGCASSPKKDLNNFLTGCMTAYLRFESKGPDYFIIRPDEDVPFSYEIRYANFWCTNAELAKKK